jgi:hypothetical protein
MTNLLFTLLLLIPHASPKYILVDSSKNIKVAEHVRTSINLIPNVSLVTNSVFKKNEMLSLVTTLSTLPPFPAKLTGGVLRRQIKNKKVDGLILITKKGIYIINSKNSFGPYQIPKPSKALSIKFISKLQKPSLILRNKKSSKKISWWKNWIFWAGVGVITTTVIIFSLTSQEPDTIEVYLKY